MNPSPIFDRYIPRRLLLLLVGLILTLLIAGCIASGQPDTPQPLVEITPPQATTHVEATPLPTREPIPEQPPFPSFQPETVHLTLTPFIPGL